MSHTICNQFRRAKARIEFKVTATLDEFDCVDIILLQSYERVNVKFCRNHNDNYFNIFYKFNLIIRNYNDDIYPCQIEFMEKQ